MEEHNNFTAGKGASAVMLLYLQHTHQALYLLIVSVREGIPILITQMGQSCLSPSFN